MGMRKRRREDEQPDFGMPTPEVVPVRQADEWAPQPAADDNPRQPLNSDEEVNEMEKPKYMGGWAYVFWTIVFCLPVVGFILVLIFSFVGTNVNRKKFARSFLCWMLILVILLIGLVIYIWNLLENADIDPSLIRIIQIMIRALPQMMESFNQSITAMPV